MLPEISRRCVSCGAAVRAGAKFCPQCGNVMSEGDAERAAGASSGASAVASAREPESPRASAPATKDVNVVSAGESPAPARVVAPEREARRAVPETGEAASPYAPTPTPHTQAVTPPVQAEDAAAFEDAAAAEEKRGRVARVREGTRARVERVKGDALVALEEAPDDSGLRFVAVAAVLFVLFIAFLLLSVTILR